MKDKFEILQDIVGERLKNQWALSLPDFYELLKEVEIRYREISVFGYTLRKDRK